MNSISIIIPVLNETKLFVKLLQFLKQQLSKTNYEIIVVDGGSENKKLQFLNKIKGIILLKTNFANRAKQMNFGAENAKNEILYFLHADSKPPILFYKNITEKIATNNLGCFCASYNSNKFIFKINSWFTKLPFEFCRGGDQSLFVLKNTFFTIGKFNENFEIMEEYEFYRRAKKLNYKFLILKNPIAISLRKYENRSWFKVNKANLVAIWMFKKDKSPKKIKEKYLQLLA